jgi:hypothetical protein
MVENLKVSDVSNLPALLKNWRYECYMNEEAHYLSAKKALHSAGF